MVSRLFSARSNVKNARLPRVFPKLRLCSLRTLSHCASLGVWDTATTNMMMATTMMKHLATTPLLLLLLCLSPTFAQDDCVSGTDKLLNNNTALEAAAEDMFSKIQQDFQMTLTSFCDFAEGSISCRINLEAYSSEVEQACQDQNGTSITKDVELTCAGQVQGIEVPDFSFDIFRVPVCVDDSCDTENLPAEVDDMVNDIVDGYVNEIESGVGDGSVMCDAKTSGEGEVGATSGGVSSFGATVSIASVSGVALFSWIMA